MTESGHVIERFCALRSLEILTVLMIFMIMLISLQGGDAELVHDHRDSYSYKRLGPYFHHDIVNGTNVTDTIVLGGKGGSGFGTLSVFDDPLTVTPDINSATVARSQGLQVVVFPGHIIGSSANAQEQRRSLFEEGCCSLKNSLDGQNALITNTVVFPNGTLSFTGAFFATQSINRFHCLGGTGGFQSVTQGYMELTVYKFGPNLNAIMNVTMYLR